MLKSKIKSKSKSKIKSRKQKSRNQKSEDRKQKSPGRTQRQAKANIIESNVGKVPVADRTTEIVSSIVPRTAANCPFRFVPPIDFI